MRIIAVPGIDDRDGTGLHDGLQKNVLIAESSLTEGWCFEKRPSLSVSSSSSGDGNGMVDFDDDTITVYADKVYIYDGSAFTEIGTVIDSRFDFAESV